MPQNISLEQCVLAYWSFISLKIHGESKDWWSFKRPAIIGVIFRKLLIGWFISIRYLISFYFDAFYSLRNIFDSVIEILHWKYDVAKTCEIVATWCLFFTKTAQSLEKLLASTRTVFITFSLELILILWKGNKNTLLKRLIHHSFIQNSANWAAFFRNWEKKATFFDLDFWKYFLRVAFWKWGWPRSLTLPKNESVT